MTEETLFHEALAKPAGERAAFLDMACAGQPQLRAAVAALLAAHEASGSFLDRPLLAPVQTVDSDPNQHGGAAEGEFTSQPAEAPPRIVPTTDHHPQVKPGLVIAGRYILQQQLGEGGMGEVWVAKQTEPVKRKVALKLIKTGMDSRAVSQRFEQERQALALMDHPNIARVLDGGLTPTGQPFFVMELVNGLPLTKFCDEAMLTPRERLKLFVPICQAVQHAHQKGIVHRDLKPANILVTLIDGQPVPKVIDFGVAKATGGKLTDESLSTQFGAVVGTLEYMSPEQAGFAGVDVDTRADLYSLGVILYELLTGLRPIDAERLRKAALTEMIRLIREEEPSKPSTRLSTAEALPSLAALRQIEPRKLIVLLRGELDCVVMKCLEKQRERRYETANSLARDVQRYLADELVEARPPSASYRLGKFLKRHKGPVVAASLVLLALVAGMAGTTFGLVRAEQLRHEAEQAQADEARQRSLAEAKEREAQKEKKNALKATAAESAALRQTRQRLRQIEKGVDLLASLLTGINPRNEEKGGPKLYEQLRTRASKAADQLDAESVGDPQAVARLQTILGNTLVELGDLSKAIALLQKACATHQRELGEDHPDTLASRGSLAVAYQAAGKLDLAIPLFERNLKVREAKRGNDHPDTLRSRNNLASAYQAAGKLDRAIPLYQRTLQAYEAKLGDDHPNTLHARNNLADAYQAIGKLDWAIPLLERTLQSFEAKLGDDHPETLRARNNLASVYKAVGKLDRATPLLQRTVHTFEAKLGDDHPDTLTSRNNLATAYMATRKWGLAIPLLERTLEACAAKLGDDHPETLRARNNLASAYQFAGKLDLALPLLEGTLKACAAKLGDDHPNTLTCRNNLAMAYLATGKWDLAIPIFEGTLQARAAKLGDDHPDTLTSRNNLATAYRAAGKLDLALPLFERAARGIEKLHFRHENARRIIPNTVAAYLAAKQLDKAEGWQRKWLAVVRQQAGDRSPSYAGELAVLGLSLLQQQKWAAAEAPLRECLALRAKTQPDAWTTFNTQSMLGGALLGQKKYAEAEPLLLAGYEGLKKQEAKIPPPGMVRLIKAVERLVQLYEATGKKDDAAKWRKELEACKPQASPK